MLFQRQIEISAHLEPHSVRRIGESDRWYVGEPTRSCIFLMQDDSSSHGLLWDVLFCELFDRKPTKLRDKGNASWMLNCLARRDHTSRTNTGCGSTCLNLIKSRCGRTLITNNLRFLETQICPLSWMHLNFTSEFTFSAPS